MPPWLAAHSGRPRLPALVMSLSFLNLIGEVNAQIAPAKVESTRPGEIAEIVITPPEQKTRGEIEEWISRLGAPRFKEREEATKSLIGLGSASLEGLSIAYEAAQDLEVRLQIESIVRSIYLDYHVYGRNGFLGVSLQPFIPDVSPRTPAPKNVVGIKVGQVIKNTAAERSGLQVEDIIVGVDGVTLEDAGLQSVEAFSGAVRSRRPGTPMALMVLRKGRETAVPVTMGRCPTDVVREGNVPVIQQAAAEAEQRFPLWWATHFLVPQRASNGNGGK